MPIRLLTRLSKAGNGGSVSGRVTRRGLAWTTHQPSVKVNSGKKNTVVLQRFLLDAQPFDGLESNPSSLASGKRPCQPTRGFWFACRDLTNRKFLKIFFLKSFY
jgi:hypothetical protein